jgi:ATP adenylyltransferase
MDILWSPWRFNYVTESSKRKGEGKCIFCEIPNFSDEEKYVLYRGNLSYSVLNLYPYNTGHLMVVPYRHVPSLDLLRDEEMLEIFKQIRAALRAVREVYSPDGFNVGVNIGRSAGAGVESHVHIHVVPRWVGDSNFMVITANVKVMPETLNNTYFKLKSRLNSLIGSDEVVFDR